MKKTLAKSDSAPRLIRWLIPSLLSFLFLWAILAPESLWLSTAKLCMSAGLTSWAEKSLGQITTPSASADLLRARLGFNSGDFPTVVENFLRVGPETAEDEVMLGTSLARIGRWTEALPVLEHARSQGAEGGNVLSELADAYAYLGLYEQAKQAIKELRSLPDFEAAALYRSGTILREQGDYEGFMSEWLAMTRMPDVTEKMKLDWDRVHLELAEICASRGKFSEASELIDLVESSARSWFIRGQIQAGQGQPADAEASFRTAIELEPAIINPRVELARILFADGRVIEALDILKPVEGRGDSLPTDICNLLQMIHTRLQQPEKAAEWQKHRETAQKRNERLSTLSRLSTEGGSVTARVIRAWKFASIGNPHQAMVILDPITSAIESGASRSQEAQFVLQLRKAIVEGKPLPDLLDFISDEDQAPKKIDESSKNE